MYALLVYLLLIADLVFLAWFVWDYRKMTRRLGKPGERLTMDHKDGGAR